MTCSVFKADKFNKITVEHSAEERLDYALDWNEVLVQDDNDTVTTNLVTAVGGITIVSQNYTAGIQKAFVTTSTPTTENYLKYTIETTGGRKYVRLVYFNIV